MEENVEFDVTDETTADALVLLPPSVRRTLRWAVIGVFQARDLPVTDALPAGIDAYVECSFGGSAPVRTDVVTRLVGGSRFARGVGLDVTWNQELWVPYQVGFDAMMLRRRAR